MCPNINLLRSYKVFPSEINFRYQAHKFFIYVYLNPFVEYPTAMKAKAGSPPKEYCFAYEPIYLGKGTGSGYRHNQHLKAFQNKSERNINKIKAFQTIQDKMAKAVATEDHTKPWNWKEYQQEYVIILETFQDPKELIKFEMQMINTFGTQWDNTGPLANKIKNAFKFDGLSQGRVDAFDL